ncbi:hypothetical protein HDU92_002567 [Lobulomyces angularis]|nr:hypothetical protein HDU92_002567 [Lobulomyces angularis]
MVLISNAVDQAISGFIASFISTGILHPLDLIKTRFQVNESGRMKTYSTFMNIKQTEGLKTLYRGLSANLAGGTISWGLYFLLYEKFKENSKGVRQKNLNPTQHLICSAQAGALTSLVTNPIWLVKTRLCASKYSDPDAFKGLFDGLYRTWKFEGTKGLYKGIVPGLFGVSHGAIQFMVYEELKILRKESYGKSTTKLSTLEYITFAASSKVFATVCTYPYQVIRARMQNEKSNTSHYNGLVKTVVRIFKNESFVGFYKGLGPNIIRVLPGTCITFGVYENYNRHKTGFNSEVTEWASAILEADGQPSFRIQVRAVPNSPGLADISLIGAASLGWIGIGTGSKMDGSKLDICWPTSDGTSASLVSKLGQGHNVIPLEETLTLNTVESKVHQPMENVTDFPIFVCRYTHQLPEVLPTEFMWAIGPQVPASADAIGAHDMGKYGPFSAKQLFSIAAGKQIVVPEESQAKPVASTLTASTTTAPTTSPSATNFIIETRNCSGSINIKFAPFLVYLNYFGLKPLWIGLWAICFCSWFGFELEFDKAAFETGSLNWILFYAIQWGDVWLFEYRLKQFKQNHTLSRYIWMICIIGTAGGAALRLADIADRTMHNNSTHSSFYNIFYFSLLAICDFVLQYNFIKELHKSFKVAGKKKSGITSILMMLVRSVGMQLFFITASIILRLACEFQGTELSIQINNIFINFDTSINSFTLFDLLLSKIEKADLKTKRLNGSNITTPSTNSGFSSFNNTNSESVKV